jgi:hypothetical protein
MKIINSTMHHLDNEQRFYTLDNGEKNELIDFQIEHFREAERYYAKEAEYNNLNRSIVSTDKKILQEIWLGEAKLSIVDFLQKGIDAGIWNEQFQIITQKGTLYGTGKTLLANLAIALRGYSISHETDYKVIGKAFCTVFNVEIKESTKEPYKAFNTVNNKILVQLKRAFSIR